MRVEYSEPLAAWIFPGHGTHGSCAMDECARTCFVYFSKKIVAVGESKVTTTKEQRTTQAGCTTTSAEGRAHLTAHFTAAKEPPACIYFSAFRRMRLTHSAVISKTYVKKNVGNLNEATTPARKNIQKRANCKRSIRRIKQIRERF